MPRKNTKVTKAPDAPPEPEDNSLAEGYEIPAAPPEVVRDPAKYKKWLEYWESVSDWWTSERQNSERRGWL